MKIVFTGGGSAGHFYPVIAVAEEIKNLVDQEKLARVEMYYFSTSPYDAHALFQNNINFVKIPAGKLRIYSSLKNLFDPFKVVVGIFKALWELFQIFPDIVFAKGGYASFPTLVAARILGIPVVIHESDSVPGRVNKWAGKFAKYIAVSYAECAKFFPKGTTARTGQPVRKGVMRPIKDGAFEYLELEPNVPVVFITGGSQGAQIINDAILGALKDLVPFLQIIHQGGIKNLDTLVAESKEILRDNEYASRYKPFGYLNSLAFAMSAGAASLVITRAGSTLFEVASWGVPALVIPITKSNGNHQRENAYNYARAGACVVIEEGNLTPSVLVSEIRRILDNPSLQEEMKKNARDFFEPDAARIIAQKLIDILLVHQPEGGKKDDGQGTLASLPRNPVV